MAQDRRRTANFGLLAVSAAAEALQDANWQPTANYDQERTVRSIVLSSLMLMQIGRLPRDWYWGF
jgi:3-oxoacyl-(acyl-carrier-protein) synthase